VGELGLPRQLHRWLPAACATARAPSSRVQGSCSAWVRWRRGRVSGRSSAQVHDSQWLAVAFRAAFAVCSRVRGLGGTRLVPRPLPDAKVLRHAPEGRGPLFFRHSKQKKEKFLRAKDRQGWSARKSREPQSLVARGTKHIDSLLPRPGGWSPRSLCLPSQSQAKGLFSAKVACGVAWWVRRIRPCRSVGTSGSWGAVRARSVGAVALSSAPHPSHCFQR